MTRINQYDMGRAFEFGIASQIAYLSSVKILENSSFNLSRESFNKMSEIEKRKIKKAANSAIEFLISKEKFFESPNFIIQIQSDQTGRSGDVRDILLKNNLLETEIGISAKNRHYAVKHSRLSESINFGRDWFGLDCSENYFKSVSPIFDDLREKRIQGIKWKDIPNKKGNYYIPVLNAFAKEMNSLYEKDSTRLANGIIKYLLGSYDYYKIIKENGSVTIISFNLNGNLNWGSKLPIPNKLIDISMKENSETTLFMVFDKGWQISFRIHSASTIVEPSLKFDIEPVGFPSGISRHIVEY